jgi:hypothetical protein
MNFVYFSAIESLGKVRTGLADNTLYVVRTATGTLLGQNNYNMGNFLWGAAANAAGVPKSLAKAGAPINNFFNDKNPPWHLDAPDDQFSIGQGWDWQKSNTQKKNSTNKNSSYNFHNQNNMKILNSSFITVCLVSILLSCNNFSANKGATIRNSIDSIPYAIDDQTIASLKNWNVFRRYETIGMMNYCDTPSKTLVTIKKGNIYGIKSAQYNDTVFTFFDIKTNLDTIKYLKASDVINRYKLFELYQLDGIRWSCEDKILFFSNGKQTIAYQSDTCSYNLLHDKNYEMICSNWFVFKRV